MLEVLSICRLIQFGFIRKTLLHPSGPYYKTFLSELRKQQKLGKLVNFY